MTTQIVHIMFKFVTLPVSLASVGMTIAAAEKVSPSLMFIAVLLSGIALLTALPIVIKSRSKRPHAVQSSQAAHSVGH